MQYFKSCGITPSPNSPCTEILVSWHPLGDILLKYAAKVGNFGKILHSVADKNGKGSPFLIADRRVSELIPVLGSQPAGDASHKPGGRLPLFSARPAVTLTTLKRAATNFAAW